MFLVFNKEKIFAYLVSVITVVVLFFVANSIYNNNESISTSAGVNSNLPIYNVETDKNKVSLTINCAWNADDIDSILETLEKENVKVTFFMVGDWVDKFPDAVKKISEAGHEIGSHSNTHPHVTKLSYEENVKEIEESSKKTEYLTGKKITIWRI